MALTFYMVCCRSNADLFYIAGGTKENLSRRLVAYNKERRDNEEGCARNFLHKPSFVLHIYGEEFL